MAAVEAIQVFGRAVKSAIFVDFHNIGVKVGTAAFSERLPAWLAWLEDGIFDPNQRKRQFLLKRAYLTEPFKQYTAAFRDAGFDTIPTSADMVIALDAAESLYINQNIQEYVILTVDGDFEDLLERLGERQKNRVVTIEPGTPSDTAFPPVSDITIPLNTLRSAFQYQRKLPRWKRFAKFFRASAERAANFVSSVLSRVRNRYRTFRRRSVNAQLLKTASNHAAELALHTRPGTKLGRRTIMRHLKSKMPQQKAVNQFFGCASYEEMIQKFVEIRPDLELVRELNGGIAIIAPRKEL